MKHSIILDILVDSFDHRFDTSFGNPLERDRIDAQIQSTHNWSTSLGQPQKVPHMVQNVLNQRMDSVDWVLIPEDFHTIHSKKLFRRIFSFLSKHALAQMDSARSEEGLRIQSSPVEISLLWKIYTFLLTEDGKQQLHDGILSMMDLSFEWIDSQDVEDIYSVSGIAHRETCERLAEKIASVNSRVQSIVNAWRYVDEYTSAIRWILKDYHTREMNGAHENLKQTLKHPAWLYSHRKTFHTSYEQNAEALLRLREEVWIVRYT